MSMITDHSLDQDVFVQVLDVSSCSSLSDNSLRALAHGCPQVPAGAFPLTLGLQVIVGAGGPGPFEHPSFSVIRIGDLEHARIVAEVITLLLVWMDGIQ